VVNRHQPSYDLGHRRVSIWTAVGRLALAECTPCAHDRHTPTRYSAPPRTENSSCRTEHGRAERVHTFAEKQARALCWSTSGHLLTSRRSSSLSRKVIKSRS